MDERLFMHRYRISAHLTELCDANPQVIVHRCDGGEDPVDGTYVFALALATNYWSMYNSGLHTNWSGLMSGTRGAAF